MRSDLLAGERRSRRRRRALATVSTAAVLAALAGVCARVLPGAALPPQSGDAGVAAAPASPPAVAIPDPGSGGASARETPASSVLRTRPLSAWLGEVAREAGRDLVLSPDLRGDLTASESTRLDWHRRLEAYARVSGFDFTVSDGLIEASRADAEGERTRHDPHAAATDGGRESAQPRGSVATGATDGASAAPAAGAAAPAVAAAKIEVQTRVVRLAYAPAKETAAVLARAGDALDVTATPDPSSNAVVLSGPPSGLGRMLRVLAELDRPRRRILLEAKIVEVMRSARLDLGVEWKLTGTVGGDVKFPPTVSEAGSAALVVATHGASALDARISALEAGGKLRVVSRPSVVMIEGSPATIESVRILRIRLPSNGTVVGDEVVAAPSGRATEDIPVGVRLEVTPAIRGSGRVLLRIRAKSSSLGAPLPPDDIPEELSRMVDAEVLVASGETAVLGGLSREAGTRSGAGVPGLRHIPGVGLLFGKSSKVDDDEELVVIVTPRVLD